MYLHLSKKISIPNVQKLRCISWNQGQDWIACGGDNGLLKVLKFDNGRRSDEDRSVTAQPSSQISGTQTLEGHSGSVCCVAFNSSFKKMTSSDDSGHIIVWSLHHSMWYEEMVNNRNKSVVVDLKWSPDGQRICISYEDGQVIVGSVAGGRIWSRQLTEELRLCEWSPNMRNLIFVSRSGEAQLYDSAGSFITKMPISAVNPKDRVPIIGLHWYNGDHGYIDRDAPMLVIAFQNGKVQIMKSETDSSPVLVDTGLELCCCQWNHNGTVLALGGLDKQEGGKGQNKIQFYSPYGTNIRTVPLAKNITNPIAALSWSGNGLGIAIAAGPLIFFGNVIPDMKWSFFSKCLVYCYNKFDRTDQCVMFYNTSTSERYVKFTSKVYGACSFGELCCLFTGTNESGTYGVILCNTIGSPIESRYINVEPKYCVMTEEYAICASDTSIFVWGYAASHAQYGVLSSYNGVRETTISIDEGSYTQSTADPICAISATNRMLVAGRSSGLVHCYTLPHGHLEKKAILKCRPEKISLNCDGTKMSVIDFGGVPSLFVFKSTETSEGEQTPIELRDVWDIRWASDNPDLFALMEKRRLYIYRGTKPEEPVLCNAHICDFRDLEVTCLNLDAIYESPEEPEDTTVIKFETLSLRDARTMIGTVNLADSYRYVEEHSHPRLWRLLAEESLQKLDFALADKAYVQCRDYSGVQFVKKLKLMTDPRMQRAEVAIWLEDYDQAEKLYHDMDRLDLALDLRQKLGDWLSVVKLLNMPETANDEMMTLANNRIGDSHAEKHRWRLAARYYSLARNTEALINVFYMLEEYEKLSGLLRDIPDGSPLLKDIASKFQSVGMYNQAVDAYLKLGDVKAGIDCCVLLNQWKKAVELAEAHQFPQIESLLAKYASHLLKDNTTQGTFAAIELYRKANKATEAAGILAGLALNCGRKRVNPLRAKQLYILAGLQMEEFRMKTLDTATTTGMDTTTATAVTLDLLMTQDTSTSGKKMLEKHWRGGEAFHFLLLTYKQIYKGQFSTAYSLLTAYRLTAYDDILDPKEVYSLLAYISYQCKHFGICSDAFMHLESLESASDEEVKRYQDLAIRIFTKNDAVDPDPDNMVECPKRCGRFNLPWALECDSCHAKITPSMVTGGPLPNEDRSTMSVYRCPRCRHRAEKRDLQGWNYCPFCHGPL